MVIVIINALAYQRNDLPSPGASNSRNLPRLACSAWRWDSSSGQGKIFWSCSLTHLHCQRPTPRLAFLTAEPRRGLDIHAVAVHGAYAGPFRLARLVATADQEKDQEQDYQSVHSTFLQSPIINTFLASNSNC